LPVAKANRKSSFLLSITLLGTAAKAAAFHLLAPVSDRS